MNGSMNSFTNERYIHSHSVQLSSTDIYATGIVSGTRGRQAKRRWGANWGQIREKRQARWEEGNKKQKRQSLWGQMMSVSLSHGSGMWFKIIIALRCILTSF